MRCLESVPSRFKISRPTHALWWTRLAVLISCFAALGVPNLAAAQSEMGRPALAADPSIPHQRLAQQEKKDTKPQQGKTDAPPASAGAPQAKAAEPWALSCSNQNGTFACEMRQGIVDEKTRGGILLIIVRNTTTKDRTAFLFRLVHGVYLPAGLTVQIDGGKPTKLEFQKSDRFGVYAGLPIDTTLLGELKKGRELIIAFEPRKGKTVQLKAPLSGFGPAHDRVAAKG
jgi:invasion protein IalB